MKFRLETATQFDPNSGVLEMFDFFATSDWNTNRAEVEGNFDLAVRFDNIIAARIVDNSNNVLATWTPEDGVWVQD